MQKQTKPLKQEQNTDERLLEPCLNNVWFTPNLISYLNYVQTSRTPFDVAYPLNLSSNLECKVKFPLMKLVYSFKSLTMFGGWLIILREVVRTYTFLCVQWRYMCL